MKNIFYTLCLVLVATPVHAKNYIARDGVFDDTLQDLQLTMLRESAVKLSRLATSRCLGFLDSWQKTMRVAESEIVLRDTLKGRINAWVGGKVSTRDATMSGLHQKKNSLQEYGEGVAAEASRFDRIAARCSAAQSPQEVYESAEDLFDAIAQY